MKYDEIKKFWVKSGKVELDSDGLKPTARDPYLQELNEYYIGNLLYRDMVVLDVGCGEGSSTVKFAKTVKRVIGVDYSKTLIEQAVTKSVSNTKFIVGDVLKLKKLFPHNKFDAVISIRCLINVPTKKQQYLGLENLFFVLKKGGILLLSEGYKKGWRGINLHRKRNGLPEMKITPHNKLLGDELEGFLKEHGTIMGFIGFGEYLYGSRIVHPLLYDEVKHNAHINKIYADIQKNDMGRNYCDCSYGGIYVMRKYG